MSRYKNYINGVIDNINHDLLHLENRVKALESQRTGVVDEEDAAVLAEAAMVEARLDMTQIELIKLTALVRMAYIPCREIGMVGVLPGRRCGKCANCFLHKKVNPKN